MTPRRRARAQVERTPRREVRPGVSAATWWGDEDLRARLERLAPPPAEFRREYMGTFPDPVRPPPPPDVMTLETLDRLVQLLKDAPGPPPGAIVVPPWAARVASDPYYPDGLADAWGDPTLDGWRREGIERRALATTGRVLVAWLIGRWRR